VGLREQAAADLKLILEDSAAGFGWPITVTSPNGTDTAELTGYSNDIAQAIDPETGMLVSGRVASVVLSIGTLEDAGFTEVPRGTAESSGRPWVIEFADINGAPHRFKVREARRDRALGCVVCILENIV
jgi:hypothetical protein